MRHLLVLLLLFESKVKAFLRNPSRQTALFLSLNIQPVYIRKTQEEMTAGSRQRRPDVQTEEDEGDVFSETPLPGTGVQTPIRSISAHELVDKINKEELDKDRFQVQYKVQSSGEVKRPSSCKRKSCSSVEVGIKLHRRSSNVGHPRNPGMANKENELTCSDDVRGIRYENYGLPVNSAEASKMAGASSKYSDFAELSKEHEAMTRILFGRDLRLKVALTLWQRNASELVSYLIRIQDTGVLLDCLPVLTNNLQTETPCLSLGCCVDLLPHIKGVLSSKYEQHIMVGLHWVQSVIRKWWPELSKSEKRLQGSCSEDRNVGIMRQRLKDLWKDGARLCLVPGSVGELAKAIEAYVLQLP